VTPYMRDCEGSVGSLTVLEKRSVFGLYAHCSSPYYGSIRCLIPVHPVAFSTPRTIEIMCGLIIDQSPFKPLAMFRRPATTLLVANTSGWSVAEE
jgi:hypothetical protein